MTDETEPQPTEENDEKPTREQHADLTRKLLGDQAARDKLKGDDWVQKRDAEEQSREAEQNNEVENGA